MSDSQELEAALLLNEAGELMLAIRTPLPSQPVAVTYYTEGKTLEVSWENGAVDALPQALTNEMDMAIRKAIEASVEILLVEMSDDGPVSGYDLPIFAA